MLSRRCHSGEWKRRAKKHQVMRKLVAEEEPSWELEAVNQRLLFLGATNNPALGITYMGTVRRKFANANNRIWIQVSNIP